MPNLTAGYNINFKEFFLTKNSKPTIYIIAGPNGSGKTTFGELLFSTKHQIKVFLNPDLIAQGISKIDFNEASFQAGRHIISEVIDRIENKNSFAFETTMSGHNWLKHLKKAKSCGYQILIYFVCLKSKKLNYERILNRVKLGGHYIDKSTLERRHLRVFNNFWSLYRPLADNWFIFDNSGSLPELVISMADFDQLSIKKKTQLANSFLKGNYGLKKK